MMETATLYDILALIKLASSEGSEVSLITRNLARALAARILKV